MVCFGGLEFIAAGYLIAEHNKKKKKEEQKRIEEEEAAARQQEVALHSSHHHHHRRRRRHSDSEREERRHKERAWVAPVPIKERRELEYRPRKEKRRDGDSRSSSPAPRRGSGTSHKSHIDRPYAHNPSMSATQLNRPYPNAYPTSNAMTTYLAPPQQQSFARAGSDPPPSRMHNQVPHGQPMAPASHHNQMIPAHQQIHNSIFPTAPPSLYRASPLSQAISPNTGRGSPRTNRPYPTYHPPSPPSPPPPASAFSSRPQYTTPSPHSSQAPLALPPPPEGVWELAASDAGHPNPAHLNPSSSRQRSSSTSSRPHVHFADGLDVHENIADPPPPYQEY